MQVKVKVRPGRVVQFPKICVHCARPAAERLPLKRRIGRVTRLIDVPLCANCAREAGRRSPEEEQWLRLSWVAAVVAALVAGALLVIVLPAGMPALLRLAIALVVAVPAGRAAYDLCRRRSRAAARPEKKAVLHAAQMVTFSWRATTFEFKNDLFAERFIELNQHLLMELQ
ncbi:MAG: hypothetical protein L0332_11405 [Chloroflexi bacterium]|nr:hypothetical protein [Chloroflexota bacterium]MCI0575891.1 hypothetical protein [Chloroflexota bacterium]MCI0648551.1 hypothetical protein [Chloroflexota bacterium]MCI0727314.1 hypothetical protein [Chloroflexota bacterium]